LFQVNEHKLLHCILGLDPNAHLGKSIEEIYDHMIDMVRYFQNSF